MDKKSLTSISHEKDKRKKEADKATKQIAKTEVDIVKVADQVGAIESGLSDVNQKIKEARGRVLDSAAKAGAQDAELAKQQETAARHERGSVVEIEKHTRSEQGKADRVKPTDSRILDGTQLSKTLEDAGRALNDIAKDLESTASKTSEQRTRSENAISSAVKRNRK